MNPVLTEIYSTIIPSMPFIITAYVLIWAVLMIYIFITHRSVKSSLKQIEALEEELADRKAKESR